MESIVIDTCSIVNLINSNLAEKVLGDTNFKFIVGPMVRIELAKEAKQLPAINNLEDLGLLSYYDKRVDLSIFNNLISRFSLGDGETECITIAIANGFRICCDDRKARIAAESVVGKEKCYGSIAALKFAVENDIILCSIANDGYIEMKNKGGFLPKEITRTYFCKAL